jgi:hypothetical protein
MIGYMNPADNQDISVFFNFPVCLRIQIPLSSRNFARFQRAAKGAGQSAGRGGDNIIQRGGMGFVHLGVNAVMLGDLGMSAKPYRFVFLGQICPPQWSFDPFDFYFGCINNLIAHGGLLYDFLPRKHEKTETRKKQ